MIPVPLLSSPRGTELLVNPSLSVVRAGATATRIDGSGALQVVAADTLRYDYSNSAGSGWLIEAGKTNSLRNNTQSGAALPSTLPTNWTVTIPAGMTTTVEDISTYNGFPRIRLRIAGTASGTSYTLELNGQTNIVAAEAEVWSGSLYARMVDSTLPPVSHRTQMVARTAAGAAVATNSVTFTPTGTMARTENIYTLPATSERIQLRYSPTLTIGQPYDFTIDLIGAQVELSNFPSSLIKTLGAAAVARAADDVSLLLADVPQWNPLEGTFVVDFVAGASVASKYLFDAWDGTTNNRIRCFTTSLGALGVWVTVGGVTHTQIYSGGNITPFSRNKVAVSFKQDKFYIAANGNSVGSSLSGAVPVVDRVQFGANLSKTASTFLNGHVISAKHVPRAYGGAELAVLF